LDASADCVPRVCDSVVEVADSGSKSWEYPPLSESLETLVVGIGEDEDEEEDEEDEEDEESSWSV